ncbi:hypothetical protein HUN42_00057 [Streptomyces phage Dagobah]|nr:hypothetical protein HUN42_00057 [Streptomyces phage Dagobah]
MVNRELFQKIHEVITLHPEQHDQSVWEEPDPTCGTTRCVAGWAITLTTGKPVYGKGYVLHPATLALGKRPGVPSIAGELLGLNDAEADVLFYRTGSDKARDVVKAFAEGRNDDARLILSDSCY